VSLQADAHAALAQVRQIEQFLEISDASIVVLVPADKV
jgi:hypothetical protein